MIIPIHDAPPKNDKHISRFITKIALEAVASRIATTDTLLEELVDAVDMDPIRNYARYGNKPAFWQYNQRRIYGESDRFLDPNSSNVPYQILHEFDFCYDNHGEVFFILVIMGIEYVISMTNPAIDGYKEWLIKNRKHSPIERDYEKRIKRSRKK